MKDLEWVLEGGRPPTPDALRAAGHEPLAQLVEQVAAGARHVRLTSDYLVHLKQRHPKAWARIEVWLKANNVTVVVV